MNRQEFFLSVVNLRKYQKQVERTRGMDITAKRQAKQYEDLIDKEIKRVELLLREQSNQQLPGT